MPLWAAPIILPFAVSILGTAASTASVVNGSPATIVKVIHIPAPNVTLRPKINVSARLTALLADLSALAKAMPESTGNISCVEYLVELDELVDDDRPVLSALPGHALPLDSGAKACGLRSGLTVSSPIVAILAKR